MNLNEKQRWGCGTVPEKKKRVRAIGQMGRAKVKKQAGENETLPGQLKMEGVR